MITRSLCAALASATLLAGFGSPARAHPHVFIDTALTLLFDDAGRLAAVQVDWAYDDFYSLMMIEENGLDADADGTPEPEQLAGFAGQDVDWAAGFPGDLSVSQGGASLALGPPEDHAARFENGRIVTSHVRPLIDPVAATSAAPATVRAYDPTYFVAYDVPEDPVIEGGAGCSVTRDEADTAAAQAEYGDRLAEVDMTEDPFEEIELPDIGVLFADAFRLTCAPAS